MTEAGLIGLVLLGALLGFCAGVWAERRWTVAFLRGMRRDLRGSNHAADLAFRMADVVLNSLIVAIRR